MTPKHATIDDIIRAEKQADLVCPECYSQMTVKTVKNGSKWVRKVEKLVCECGYHTIKRSAKEILRDIGKEDYFNG